MEKAKSGEGLINCSWLIEKPQPAKLEMTSSMDNVGLAYCFMAVIDD
jgi:hypothetical protein